MKKILATILAVSCALSLGVTTLASEDITWPQEAALQVLKDDGTSPIVSGTSDVMQPGQTVYAVIGDANTYSSLLDKKLVTFKATKESGGKMLGKCSLVEKTIGSMGRKLCIKVVLSDTFSPDEFKAELNATFKAKVDLLALDPAAGKFPAFYPADSGAIDKTITDLASAKSELAQLEQQVQAAKDAWDNLTISHGGKTYTGGNAIESAMAAAKTAYEDAEKSIKEYTYKIDYFLGTYTFHSVSYNLDDNNVNSWELKYKYLGSHYDVTVDGISDDYRIHFKRDQAEREIKAELEKHLGNYKASKGLYEALNCEAFLNAKEGLKGIDAMLKRIAELKAYILAHEAQAARGSGYLKAGDTLIVPFKLYIQNTSIDVDVDFAAGTGGVVVKPAKNDDNEVVWENQNRELAKLTFTGDSDVTKFYPKMSTKWNNEEYAANFADGDAYLFKFVGNPAISSTSRATLTLFNPFINNDEEYVVSVEKLTVYEVIDDKLVDSTAKFTATTNDDGDEVLTTKTRILGTYIVADSEAQAEAMAATTANKETVDKDAPTAKSEKYVPSTGR